MNNLSIRILSVTTIVLFGISCSTKNKLSAPDSLYKTNKGKEIAYKSYDKSMKLWDIAYSEEFVDTDYGKSHVIISGKNNKQALVIFPGLFGDASMWYPNVGVLSKHYIVYTLDMINYGGKSQPKGKVTADFNDYNI